MGHDKLKNRKSYRKLYEKTFQGSIENCKFHRNLQNLDRKPATSLDVIINY